MENLPEVPPEPPVPTADEIFEPPKEDVLPPPEPEPPQQQEEVEPPPPPAKPKRKYNRDPEDLKKHMAMMREKSAAARAKKKVDKEKEKEKEKPAPTAPNWQNVTSKEFRPDSNTFAQFMEYYSQAEQYKTKLAQEKKEKEDAIEAEVNRRLQKRKRPRRKKVYPGVNKPLENGVFDVTASHISDQYRGYFN